jgi:hypothetical protein
VVMRLTDRGEKVLIRQGGRDSSLLCSYLRKLVVCRLRVAEIIGFPRSGTVSVRADAFAPLLPARARFPHYGLMTAWIRFLPTNHSETHTFAHNTSAHRALYGNLT